ncbi:hypothetical protein, partial [Rhodomicrobium vannielii]
MTFDRVLLETSDIDSRAADMAPAYLVTQFSTVLAGLQPKIGAPGAGSPETQAAAFIKSVGNGDSELTVDELASVLPSDIPPEKIKQFITDFNTKGQTELTLDAKELGAAFEMLTKAKAETGEGPSETGGGGGGGG